MTSPASKPEWRRALLEARRRRPDAARLAARTALTEHLVTMLARPPLSNVSAALLRSGARELTADPESAVRLQPAEPDPAPDNAAPTICAYVPLDSEPLPPELPLLLSARGWRVLLPVAVPGQPLDWAELERDGDTYTPPGDRGQPAAGGHQHPPALPRFRRSTIGILEPTGPPLGPLAVLGASVILVPALAVDRSGVRLGRGGGFYDRTLALLARASAGTPAPTRADRQTSPTPNAHHVTPTDTPVGEVPRPLTIAVVFDDEVLDALPHEPHDVRVTHLATPTGGVRPVTVTADGP